MRNVSRTLVLSGLAWASAASAFCGFYVAGANAQLFNNATMVVLMREGTRTVLSMQNNYQGPPENFAMVVPVPVVLQKENVKTLPREVFAHIDQLAAPRLVEYWEQDPCYVPQVYPAAAPMSLSGGVPKSAEKRRASDLGVTIEAQFTVGEYEVVILSAKDSGGLDTWLRQEHYQIPEGAEALLRPYVRAGMKFFVAKVDVSKVQFKDGQAMLSPLRFHYDSESFSLPVRLGLVNSSGTQDLIVHILARNQRYEVANYPNVTIPTNIDLADPAKEQFPAFYAALFDKTLEKNRGAVVTEYAWESMSCDPCPGPPLDLNALATLGADVLPGLQQQPPPPQGGPMRGRMRWGGGGMSGFVLTRLHARYGKDALGDDLIFRAAPPIVGGREFMQNDGRLEKGARPDSYNNFQGRYAIRHPWTGAITCANPRRGVWGGPPGSGYGSPPTAQAAKDLAFAPRGKVKLASLVRQDVPEIGLKASASAAPAEPPKPPPAKNACSGLDVTSCSATDGCAPRFGPSCPTCNDHVYKACDSTR